MKKYELMMRQVVIEILQGKLNIARATTKFEVTQQTVERWMKIVGEEAQGGDDQLIPHVISQAPAHHTA